MEATVSDTWPGPGGAVLFCRVPGLLAQAARRTGFAGETTPVVVTEGRLVRDGCPRATACGIRQGISLIHARRFCPVLIAVPIEDVQPGPPIFLDVLADWADVVEPDGPDAAYVQVAAPLIPLARRSLTDRLAAALGLAALIGLGRSKLAARACAECGLPASRLAAASVDWLWPEDTKVPATLKRLGLETFGQVAAVGEGALFYQFGRIGHLLHRRALGQDLTPVRALYPPPRADAARDLSECPVEDWDVLQTALEDVCADAVRQMKSLGSPGRRLVLCVTTERGEETREWLLPAPVQCAVDVLSAARRVLGRMPVGAPVTGLRLLVEDLDAASARTPGLFAGEARTDPAALLAVRRLLTARYGLRGLRTLGQMPASPRDQRRACLREHWRAAP